MYSVVFHCNRDVKEVDLFAFLDEYSFQSVIVINLTLEFLPFNCIFFEIVLRQGYHQCIFYIGGGACGI